MSGPERRLLTHQAPSGLLASAHILATTGQRGWRPRSIGLAMAASLVVGLVGGSLLARPDAPQVTVADARVPGSDVALAARQPEDESVRLVCYAPDAARVSVAGSFNAWSVQGAPMRPVGGGLFAVDLTLPEGRHEYMFVVNGERWIPDPTAPLAADDGFGQRNSVIEI
jgi:anti-sigma-K factor RskA